MAYTLIGWLGDKKPTYRCLEGFQKKNKPFAFLSSTKEGWAKILKDKDKQACWIVQGWLHLGLGHMI